MEFEFTGTVIAWRGPAPYLFVRVPDDVAHVLSENLPLLTYGWGCIPARVTSGSTSVTTSLMPKDGGYLVPLKVALRRPEHIEPGDVVPLRVEVDLRLP